MASVIHTTFFWVSRIPIKNLAHKSILLCLLQEFLCLSKYSTTLQTGSKNNFRCLMSKVNRLGLSCFTVNAVVTQPPRIIQSCERSIQKDISKYNKINFQCVDMLQVVSQLGQNSTAPGIKLLNLRKNSQEFDKLRRIEAQKQEFLEKYNNQVKLTSICKNK